ncbi:hypothetical protein AB0I55_11710 [Actinocatenispora sera]|uniref:hypothetical protein n=1 Tax=Actinocatenispora sera TaxID=390989 RepID=UPI0033FA0342
MTDAGAAPPDPVGVRRSPLRRHLVSVLLVVAILVLIVLLAIKGGTNHRLPTAAASPSPSASPSNAGSRYAPLTTPPDHGTVKIDETGFENIRDVAGEPQVTWGAIIENTSGKATAAVELRITYLDRAGKKLKVEDFYERAAVPAVLPGRRTGVGGVTYLDDPAVAAVRIRVGTTRWWVEPGTPPTLAAGRIRTDWRDKGEQVPYWGGGKIGAFRNDRGTLYVTFRVDSSYRTVLSRAGVTAVFRNAKGHIVGGSTMTDLGLDVVLPPGWSDQSLRVKYGPPEDVDEARTEIYVYPSTT